MKSNEVITSILGRCLMEPNFLSLALQDPEEALKPYALKPEDQLAMLEFDFNNIHKFAGFITKVKNNNTWQSYQHTRLALRTFNLEAALFKEYFPDFTAFKSETNKSYEDRLDHFFNFATQFLENKESKEYSICLTLLNHEQTLRKIKRSASRIEISKPPQTSINTACIPQIKPDVFIVRSSFNPFDLIHMLKSKTGFKNIEPQHLWLLYRYENGSPHISIQENYVGEILDMLNEKNTIETIYKTYIKNSGYSLPLEEMMSFFRELAKQDLISFQ